MKFIRSFASAISASSRTSKGFAITRKGKSVFLLFILLGLLVSACGIPVQPSPDVSTQKATTSPIEESAETVVVEETAIPTSEALVENNIEPDTPSLELESLMNTSYSGFYDAPIILKDGIYEEDFFLVEFIKDSVLFGDLDEDNKQDALVFLVERGGGTAAFTYVAAQLNQNGQPVDAGAVMVEDRTQIRSVIIENSQVIVDIIAHGPGDPDCCATHKMRKIYTLQDGKLVETSVESQEMEKVTVDDLDGTSWTLLSFNQDIPVSADSEITITFQDDQVSGTGGCNNYSSSFSLGDPNPFIMTISPIVATKKACPDEVLSQENVYFDALENVSLWGYKFGKLVLAYPIDQGGFFNRLVFTQKEN